MYRMLALLVLVAGCGANQPADPSEPDLAKIGTTTHTVYSDTVIASGDTAAFSATCKSTSCEFNSLFGSGEWAFGDGAHGSGSRERHRYASGGTYPVELRVGAASVTSFISLLPGFAF